MSDARTPDGRAITPSGEAAARRLSRSPKARHEANANRLKGRRSMTWLPRLMRPSGVAHHDAL